MAEQLSRITMRKTTSISSDELTIITGYVVDFEPEVPAKWEILRPVEPGEPDTEIEVGYSKNPLEPLTIEHRKRKVELTKTLYILFRYVNDLYRAKQRTEFEFEELSDVLSGDQCGVSAVALGHSIRRLAEFLEKILPPFLLNYRNKTLYVVTKVCNEK